MNTKEAIELVCVGREKLLSVSEAHKIVNVLKRGEKFENMWEEYKRVWGTGKSMEYVKQKYFPKEVKK